MRILHCCLAAFYIDDFSYQENIFPRLHREMGHTTEVVASTETYLDSVVLGHTQAGSYISKEGVPITRLPYVKWLPAWLSRKLRIYEGLHGELVRFKPDIIFLHDCQFVSIVTIARYAKNNSVTIYIDSHTDFINSGKNFISKYILHGLVYRTCVGIISPYAKCFYATLPLRAEFLSSVYGVDSSKIYLLPFGVDDSRIDQKNRIDTKLSVRNKLNIPDSAFVFVAGGKIDHRKHIHTLIDAFCLLSDNGDLRGCYLVIFGKPEASLRAAISDASKHLYVRYVDWVVAEDIHNYFWAADVAVFPGTHSVLWEEAVGLGVPCIFRRWHGIEHVDLGGNCIFIDDSDLSTISNSLLTVFNDQSKYLFMKEQATTLGPRTFSYKAIARKAIEDWKFKY